MGLQVSISIKEQKRSGEERRDEEWRGVERKKCGWDRRKRGEKKREEKKRKEKRKKWVRVGFRARRSEKLIEVEVEG